MLFPYRPLTKNMSREAWKADFDRAERVKDVRFGEKCVHLGRMAGLGGRYIPYEDIERWFISVEAAVGGEATFHICRFVVNFGEDGECMASLGEYSANLNEKTPLERVKALMKLHPHIPVGRDYDRKSALRRGEEMR